MIDTLTDAFATAQQWLFEAAVQPIAFAVGAGNLLEDGFAATGWLLVGLLQIAVLLLVIAPLERLWPVEPLRDRHAVRIDVLYTLIHRLGLFKLAMFFSVEQGLTSGIGWLRAHGLPTLQIDQLWPGVTDVAWVSFIIYLVVFDFIGYGVHRAQHRFHWWWQLHAVHHSQRQMTVWSDNRNHLLDSVIVDVVFVVVAILIGVGPSQFVALVAISQLLESLHHANLRWSWGWLGNRLVIAPSFHRRHHAVALSHEPIEADDPGAPSGGGEPRAAGSVGARFGENFGILFPWWDMLLGSADWRPGTDPTGIDDQVLRGRDYGHGFWRQQWLGLKRLAGADRPPTAP
ncbi:sterol desaturase family protein [Ottowia testudinis]|uniref:Sterol desaturase family protein n=1 Tax=Ottowia testudinis TaxID=2816950 RepID=A0A975CKY5_9BURK|nr:sterol desaturase family protein [Ottowia testudinis]QTD46912.1 sterol desaturase family protein [Ottowia testudinis]